MSFFKKVWKHFLAGDLLQQVVSKSAHFIGIVVRKILFRKNKIAGNRVFVMTYDFQFSCNPATIVKELIRRELPVDIYWAVNGFSKLEDFPPQVIPVQFRSKEMYRAQATAKVWIDNAFNCIWDAMPKKKEQVYINTWHGSMGIKQLTTNSNKVWLFRAKQANEKTDFVISNSQFENDVYKTSFWKDVPCLLYGHPRNDMLFHPEEFKAHRQEVCRFYNLSPEDRVLLYAPTFRDDGDLSCFNVDYAALKQTLEQRFGGNWVILVRLHFKNRRQDETFDTDWLKDGGIFPDMQKLLAVADAGITDYSSWAYDYLLTRRPLFLYVPDLNKYKGDRGFYYPLETTPFPISQNNEQLQKCILELDTEKYAADCESFLQSKGCVEDGQAAGRVVDKIAELMGL